MAHLPGMLIGAVVVILWKICSVRTGLYEIIPGFICSLIAIIVVSLMGKAPTEEITTRFDEGDRLYQDLQQSLKIIFSV